MAEQQKQCPQCREMINRKAKRCRYCGANIRNYAWTLVTILATLGLVVYVEVLVDQPRGPRTDLSGHPIDEKRYDRILSCEVEIEKRLDDPKSAEFPNFLTNANDYEQTSDGNELQEGFDFRAKNLFGGLQKMRAVCHYQSDDRGGWELVSADMDRI